MSARILLLDIETAPKKALVWKMWKEDISLAQLQADGYILCWSAKWLGEKDVMHDALWNHKLYKKDPENDIIITKSIHELMDKADIIIAHNGDGFDIPMINTRCVIHGLTPPSPFKSVDTLKIARRQFKFTSNRLDGLGRFLKVGRKIETSGYKLWVQVLEKDATAQKQMLDYNIQDVLLLEEVYNKLRGWDTRHPNLGMYVSDNKPTCAVCGSDHVVSKGTYTTNYRIYPRFKCVGCGHNMRGKSAISSAVTTSAKVVSTA